MPVQGKYSHILIVRARSEPASVAGPPDAMHFRTVRDVFADAAVGREVASQLGQVLYRSLLWLLHDSVLNLHRFVVNKHHATEPNQNKMTVTTDRQLYSVTHRWVLFFPKRA